MKVTEMIEKFYFKNVLISVNAAISFHCHYFSQSQTLILRRLPVISKFT